MRGSISTDTDQHKLASPGVLQWIAGGLACVLKFLAYVRVLVNEDTAHPRGMHSYALECISPRGTEVIDNGLDVSRLVLGSEWATCPLQAKQKELSNEHHRIHRVRPHLPEQRPPKGC